MRWDMLLPIWLQACSAVENLAAAVNTCPRLSTAQVVISTRTAETGLNLVALFGEIRLILLVTKSDAFVFDFP